MLLSTKWLNNYVDLTGVTPEELANKLTHAGIEVENIYQLSTATNCVVGRVIECIDHPESDHLHVCQVGLGNNEVTQIVCGAANVKTGQKVIVSKVGATLPGGIKIKQAKLRGQESNGMICSLKELGIENKLVPQEFQSGIYVLNEEAPVGADALDYLGLNDTVLELKTLNRSDCLSMYGLAYEVAAILDRDVKKPAGEVVPFTINHDFAIEIASSDCSLYYGKIMKGIQIAPSPEWMQRILIACGIRPINNVVDITNFVMMELGQPLHAFDFDKLNTNRIVVRNAYENETIVTLDGIERKLLKSDLVITDGKHPVALAGVMGGENTEIEDTTTAVMIESAVFNPVAVRKTSSRLGLRSESSNRFEKRVDANRTLYALNRAAQLMIELAHAIPNDALSVSNHAEEKDVLIKLTLNKVNKVLGIKLSEQEVADVFRRLKFDYVAVNGTFVINVPSRRPDLSIDEDLIEEIIRIIGYSHLGMTLPATDTVGALTPLQKKLRNVKNDLKAAGLDEVMTYSLVSESNARRFGHFKDTQPKLIKLSMPLSEEHGTMRLGLIGSLLEVLKYNDARNISDAAIFEIGKSYQFANDEPREVLLAAGAVTGIVNETKWQGKKELADFYYLKGILEALFIKLNVINEIRFVQADERLGTDFHPVRTAFIELSGKIIGIAGEIHPAVQKEYDLKGTYVFEINLDEIFGFKTEEEIYKTITKYPTVSRDIAVVVDEQVSAETLLDAVKKIAKNILKSVEVFDVYQGEHMEKGKKSIAFSLLFESIEKTLTDDEVNQAYDKIIHSLESQFNAVLRK